MVEGVAGPPGALLAQSVEEPEGRQRLEDRGPDGVEVDGRGHDGHVGLVGGELGDRHLRHVQGLPRVLVHGVDPGEHLHLVRDARAPPGRTRGAAGRRVPRPRHPPRWRHGTICMAMHDYLRPCPAARQVHESAFQLTRRVGVSLVECRHRADPARPPIDLPARRQVRRSRMPGSVILAGARTPIGKLSGALAGFSAMDLGGFAIAAALERARGGARATSTTCSWARCSRPGRARSPPDRRPPRAASRCRCPPPPSTRCACPGLNTHLPGRPAHRRRRGRRGGGRAAWSR